MAHHVETLLGDVEEALSFAAEIEIVLGSDLDEVRFAVFAPKNLVREVEAKAQSDTGCAAGVRGRLRRHQSSFEGGAKTFSAARPN